MRSPIQRIKPSTRLAGLCRCGLPSVVIGMLLFLAGCRDTVIDPFQNSDRYFTVYGFLDERVSDQVLRVIPITRRGTTINNPTDPAALIDAVVTTTDLQNGSTVRWTHHLESLSNGEYGHVYRATFNVRPGHRYRLEIVRNDGKRTSAETHVPNLFNTQVEVGEKYRDASQMQLQDIRLPGVASPWNIRVVYRFPNSVYIPYDRAGHASGDTSWVFTINLDEDIPRLAAVLGIDEADVQWSSMGVDVQVLDESWDPPLDIFDPEILAQPDSLTNIENGYGFFGSVGLLQASWEDLR